MNIWAAGRAICEGEAGDFLVTPDKRENVTKDCSFVLLCEKKTVSKELLESLRKEGYKINLVSTGGRTPNDIKEAILRATEDLEDENFYLFMLHDYDPTGIMLYHELKKYYSKFIDAGVNGNFLQFLKENGDFDSRLVEEQCLNKQYYVQLEEEIGESEVYSAEDFEWLQGVEFIVKDKKGRDKPNWRGHRIEIDAIHVQYGIEPFVEYLKTLISLHCKCWDLARIGLEEFDLEVPDNPFQERLNELEDEIKTEYGRLYRKFEDPLARILRITKNTLIEQKKAFNDFASKHGITQKYSWENEYGLTVDKRTEVVEDFEEHFDREYIHDFSGELDNLNKKVHNYCGDILTAEGDLNEEFDDLQDNVNEFAEEDEDLPQFEEKLKDVDWGKDNFDEVTIPDEKEVIQKVIDKLKERLLELEMEEGV